MDARAKPGIFVANHSFRDFSQCAAIIGTAIFAYISIQHNRFVEYLKLTNDVLNAHYTDTAAKILAELLARHGYDLRAAKAEIDATSTAEGHERNRSAVGVFWYLSSLYSVVLSTARSS